jgi:hypothetical protein
VTDAGIPNVHALSKKPQLAEAIILENGDSIHFVTASEQCALKHQPVVDITLGHAQSTCSAMQVISAQWYPSWHTE